MMRNMFAWLLKHAPQAIPLELVKGAFREPSTEEMVIKRRAKLIQKAIHNESLQPSLIDNIVQLVSISELQSLIRTKNNLLPFLLSKPTIDPDTKMVLIDLHDSRDDVSEDLTDSSDSHMHPSNDAIDIANNNNNDNDDPDFLDHLPVRMRFSRFLQTHLHLRPIRVQVMHVNDRSQAQPDHIPRQNRRNVSNPGNFYEWLPMEYLIAIEKNEYIVDPDDIHEELKRKRNFDGSASAERQLYKEAKEIAGAIKNEVKAKAQRLVHSTIQAFRDDEKSISRPSFKIKYVQETAPLRASLGTGQRKLDALDNSSRYHPMGIDQTGLRKDWLHKVFFLLGGTCLGGVFEAHANDADGGLVPVPFVDPEAIGLLGRMCGKMLQLRIRPGLHWHGLILTILDPSRYPDDLIEEPTLRLLYPTVFARLDDLLAKSENPETLDECGWELYPSADGQMLPFRIITWSFERPMNAGLNAEYVKAESRMQVVDYVSSYILQLGMHLAEVLKAFQRGLMKYFDFAQYGKFFTPVDIMHILLGPTSEALSADHLLKALIFDHSCQGHHLINDLSSGQILQQNVSMREAIELVLRSFSPEQIVQFWNFLSPTPTIPIGGLASVRPTIVCAHLDLDHLPKASTCFYTITFPRYPSVLVLLKKLLYAMYNGTSVAFED